MFTEIVLIGPFGAGKTTTARLLGDKLGLSVVSLDDVCYQYSSESGWNEDEARRIYDHEGGDAFMAYTRSFEPYGVEQIVSRNPGCIIDMGGGQVVHDDLGYRERVSRALSPYCNVVLLLPSPDVHKSIQILSARRRPDYLEYLIRSPCYYALARHTVYTEDKSPEEVRDEVIDLTLGNA